MRTFRLIAVLSGCLTIGVATAQPVPEPATGYLCCNMRTDGKWISDINYAEDGRIALPAGTPLKVTGYGRQRVYIDVKGGKQAIGNDYSRALDLPTFAKRYVVQDDPAAKIASYPAGVRKAIESMRVMPGMTREQVLMSIGYPVTSENPTLDAPMWRYWLSSFAEFQVLFDDKGFVKQIDTDPATRNLVVQN